jgi:hypothetical protein
MFSAEGVFSADYSAKKLDTREGFHWAPPPAECIWVSEGSTTASLASDSDSVISPRRRRVTWGPVETRPYEVDPREYDVKWENTATTAPKSSAPQRPKLPTTLVLRNLPETVDRTYLRHFLDSCGFCCQYDFLFLPIKRKTGQHKGIAYVNFLTHEAAICAIMKLSQWCQSSWSPGCQGLHRLLESYRSSGLMSPDTPDECKPIIFLNGYLVELPQEA